MNEDKIAEITPEIVAYFKMMGKRGGKKLLKERGKEYYARIGILGRKKREENKLK